MKSVARIVGVVFLALELVQLLIVAFKHDRAVGALCAIIVGVVTAPFAYGVWAQCRLRGKRR